MALTLACVSLALLGEAGAAALRWERSRIAAEPWRMLSAHLVHLDAPHLLLNLLGLSALWALVGAAWSTARWGVMMLFIGLAIGAGLLWVPGLDWYVGLSGLLHGMLAAGACALWREWRTGSLLVIAFLVLKTAGEVIFPSEVIVQAHWLGAGAGTVAGIMAAFTRQRGA